MGSEHDFHSDSDSVISDHTDSLNSDLDDSLLGVPTGLSEIYSIANEYEEALASTVGLGTNRILAGETLNQSEHAFVAKLAQLSMASKGWLGNELALEPTALSGDESSDDDESTNTRPGPSLRRSGTMEEQESYAIEPEEVVRLLVKQFGPLATGDGPESLILETEGGLRVEDVVVIGVIHVTTHRLAFHASMLSTQPEKTSVPIKSGPAVIYFQGPFKTKRRLWVELSHDVLCTYPSSSPEHRIRPLQTILLSSITQVDPINPKCPRSLRGFAMVGGKNVKMAIKLDTEEAALDWRREITGAIYLYRSARRAALQGQTDSSGIRLSIPLERISTHRFGDVPGMTYLATLVVDLNSDFDVHRGPTANATIDARGVSPGDTKQELRMGPITADETWMLLGQYIASAKRRFSTAGSPVDHQVFIDFGLLGYDQDAHDRETDHVSRITSHSSGESSSEKSSVIDATTVTTSSAKSLASAQNAHERELTLRRTLGVDDSEQNLYIVKGSLYHQMASSGWLVLSHHHVFFYTHYYTKPDIKYRVSLANVKGASKITGNRFCPRAHGLSLHIEAHPDIKFQFRSDASRDETLTKIEEALKKHNLEAELKSAEKSTDGGSVSDGTDSATASLFPPLSRGLAAVKTLSMPFGVALNFPKAINLPREIWPTHESLHFVCLTIGSRGDVQPYIALCLGLLKEGHRVTIATHDEYAEWIQSHGIEHRSAGGDPGALMKLSVENKMFSPQFFKESITFFRPWLDQLLLDAWTACQDADVLLESPSAMAGVHIAEALEIPYFRCFTMPWTLTSEFPHAFLSSPVESPAFNRTTYVLYENVIWAATSGQINRWRRKTLGIPNTDQLHIASHKIPFLYNFSQAVVPKPLDWGDATVVTGYWFLDNPDPDWAAPADLLKFIARARTDGKPLVYIGFGSITVPHPNKITNRIMQAVVKSDVRAIISKGWSARMSTGLKDEAEMEVPPECYQVEKVPHDWLFPQIDAALHHGGAGTTGASLRAGIPTLIKPWFGDQYFWASRVQKLGAGLRVPSLHVNDIANALTKATSNRIMKEMARGVGERIRAEDGVHTALHALYTYLPRASKSKIEKKKHMECILTAREKYRD